MHRAQDKEYLKQLRQSVHHLMDDKPKVEAQHAWQSIQQHIRMNHLHESIIEELSLQEAIHMGSGIYNPEILIITVASRESSKETQSFLDLLYKGFWSPNIFYTSKFKNEKPMRSMEDSFIKLLNQQIEILNPKCIIAFGSIFDFESHLVQDYIHFPFIQTYGVSDYIQAVESQDVNKVQEIKLQIWNDLKQIRHHISSNF